jgi:hypothetical protein
LKECAEYKHANIEATIDFYKQFENKIRYDLEVNASGSETWKNMNRLPGFGDALISISKSIEDSISSYRGDVVILQVEKDNLIKLRMKEIEDGHENFVNQSKSYVSDFKRNFKTGTLGVSAQNVNREKIENEIKILTDKLMKIEVWEKQKIGERIAEFKASVKEINDRMGSRTTALKEDLEFHKKILKDNLQSIQNEVIERFRSNDNEENVEKPKTDLDIFLIEMLEEDSLWSEIDRINETYEEKISGLVCQIN